jgi:hypothetical protein
LKNISSLKLLFFKLFKKIIQKIPGPGVEVHACNLSNIEGGGTRILIRGPPGAKTLDPI